MKNIKNKKIFIISGTMGIGKTVFANKLKKQLKDETVIYDDHTYKLRTEKESLRYLFQIKTNLTSIRHTGKNFVFCTYKYPSTLQELIRLQYLENITAWIFLSINSQDFYNYPITVPKSLVNKFNYQVKNALTKKGRKTRPYLIVTKEGFALGRYKK